MRKTLVIAAREYAAAVRTKAFIFTLILLPLWMSAGPLMEKVTKRAGDVSEKRIAVLDRTGAGLYEILDESARERNQKNIFDPQTRRQTDPAFALVHIQPQGDSNDEMLRQRFELSEGLRQKKYFAVIELGRQVIEPQPGLATRPVNEQTDSLIIRYTSHTPTYQGVQRWAQQALNQAVVQKRLVAAGVSADQVKSFLIPPVLVPKPMVVQAADGTLREDESELSTVAAFIVPIVLVMLMFVIVIVGATPLTMNVVEEKQLRIAEVLLGSVTPFQLMLGKLIGGACVAVTLAAIYLAGAYFVAMRAGYQNYVNPVTLAWFVFFCVLSIFMYGSLFLAAGAAVSNMKEAQSIVMPVTILFALPLVILGALLQQPNSPLALGATFFPFSSPVATVVRIAVPPGVPAWQPLAAAAVTVLTTIAIVWAAGRIFRVGILMQGQGAKLGEMLRWVVRG